MLGNSSKRRQGAKTGILSRQALIDSRQKYMELVDNIPHLVFLKDKDGIYISCNKAFADDRGKPVNEIQGLTDRNLFPQHIAEQIKERDREVLESNTKTEYEEYYPAHDGYEIVKIIRIPVHDDQGITSGVLSVLWNITKEKQYEIAILEKEKQFRRLIDKASDIVTLADMKGKIVDANLKACEFLGYSYAELTAAHMGEIDPLIWSQQSSSPVWRELSREESVITESTYHHKDGSSFPVEINMGLHHEGGRNLVLSIARDITPRHLALKQRASLGKIFEESLNETYILLKDRLLFLQANRGARHNIQFSSEELKSRSIMDICPAIDKERFRKLVNPLDSGTRDSISFETEFLRKDGSSYPASVFVQSAEFLFFPVYVIQVLDMTQRREFEHKLQNAYDIINTSSSVAFSWDNAPGWPIRYVSENISLLLGFHPEELISGKIPYTRFIHPKDIDYYLSEITNSTSNPRQNIIDHCPYRIVSKNKEIRWVSEYTYIKRDESQNILFFQGIVEDITVQKENEFALRKIKDQWERTFHAIPDIVALLDRDMRIIRINEAGCRHFNLPSEQITGRLCYELFQDISATCLECPAAEHIDELKPFTREIFNDKLQKTFLASASPVLDEEQKVSNIVLVVKDITERKKMETQLFQSEKLATIAGLAAGVAHEINTPLSGILQSILVINNSLDSRRPENIKTAADCGIDLNRVGEYFQRAEIDFFLNGIREAAIKASNIITSLLEFSRPQKGEMVRVDINNLLDNAINLARADYNLKKKYDILNFTILREYEPELPLVTCVPMEIEQVVLNLLKNAVQAVVDGGIEPPHFLTLRTGIENTLVRIEVEDNGPGISEADIQHIFDPFFTTKEVGLGTGLGLSVSFAIINDKHHGTIDVDSTPGKGSRFIVKIPVDNEANI